MSPKNRKELEKIRKKLDKLDNEFLHLIKIRTNLVNKVVKLKEFKGEIVDNKRIEKILFDIKKKSLKNKIDSNITNKIWKNMILAYINYQKKKFKKKITICYEAEVFFLQTSHVFLLLDYISLLSI